VKNFTKKVNKLFILKASHAVLSRIERRDEDWHRRREESSPRSNRAWPTATAPDGRPATTGEGCCELAATRRGPTGGDGKVYLKDTDDRGQPTGDGQGNRPAAPDSERPTGTIGKACCELAGDPARPDRRRWKSVSKRYRRSRTADRRRPGRSARCA